MMELEGKKYKLTIWDTAGQERFRTLTSSYYRGAQGVILVYDVTNRATFDQLDVWFKELDTYATHKEVVKMVVGNKVDKESDRVVSLEEGQSLAESRGALFCECSAKTRMGILTAMEQLVGKVGRALPKTLPSPPPSLTLLLSSVDHRNAQLVAKRQKVWEIYSTGRSSSLWQWRCGWVLFLLGYPTGWVNRAHIQRAKEREQESKRERESAPFLVYRISM